MDADVEQLRVEWTEDGVEHAREFVRTGEERYLLRTYRDGDQSGCRFVYDADVDGRVQTAESSTGETVLGP